MTKPYARSLFIFRRDLRLEDNLGLLALLEQSKEVIPAFIFDPRQIDTTQNEYFSANAFQFLHRSLLELEAALQARGLKLYVFHGDPAEVVESLITSDGVRAVFVNKDYTPFARTRDKQIADICETHDVVFERHDDIALSPLEEIRTNEGKLYSVFTPFMKKAMTYEVAKPRKNNFNNYFSAALETHTRNLNDFAPKEPNDQLLIKGGRAEALELLRGGYLPQYKDRRNLLAEDGTSKLSVHHKFGTLSIRETFHHAIEHAGAHSQFISELYWRDFYYYIAYHFPIVFKRSFLPWANNLKWINDKAQFEKWCAGQTGVPMVDAAMRELNTTGWMHNRSRMIVASYLTKNLLIDWHWGEKYFAQTLVDYDPAQNNGGWQWSASTGADPRPLRIFNPYTQATKYDANAAYIYKWIPELQDVPTTKLTDGKTQDFSTLAPDYPAPLVDQKESYHRALAAYKAAKQTN
ncbi:MAG: deoxyribodipyrimidine photo-lyase [Candidatus Kaiserbacteria bacterium]|nr:deoxyribodipyrimidine photo-lyase [Candidatus Kaiserbacteria bacterium]